MDSKRIILYIALGLIGYSLANSWAHDYPSTPVKATLHASEQTVNKEQGLLPEVASQPAAAMSSEENNPSAPDSAKKSNDLIEVKTDLLAVKISLNQGDLVHAALLDYPVSTESEKPTVLLSQDPEHLYTANSNLLISTPTGSKPVNFNYTSLKKTYGLSDSEKELTVVLTGQTPEGIHVKKTFSFTKGSYLIGVKYEIENKSNAVWQGYMNAQLLRSSPIEDKTSLFHVGSFTGASYSAPGVHRYQKVSFSDMKKTALKLNSEAGWVAMQQHYFLSAWIPAEKNNHVLYTRAMQDNYAIGFVSQPLIVASGQTKAIEARLYVGPEITSTLKAIAPGLDLTVDYGWLWFLSSLLFSLMKTINTVVHNWGWSIVIVTVLIKLAFYRLSAKSYRSMAGMRKLQPKLTALRERYGDDKAKISQETMALYREEKINPLGGCLPIVIQIPVFIALYWVLLESVQLRQAPFIFWITDLAAADPFHVLPVIMGITMLIQQRLNPAPPDPMQAKIMMFLPVLFTGLFWNFPSGLVLYWIVNNTLSILQQWYITRSFNEEPSTHKRLPSSK